MGEQVEKEMSIDIEAALTKSVIINGMKIGAVRRCDVRHDISEPHALVTLELGVKRGSLKMSNDSIEFDLVNQQPMTKKEMIAFVVKHIDDNFEAAKIINKRLKREK